MWWNGRITSLTLKLWASLILVIRLTSQALFILEKKKFRCALMGGWVGSGLGLKVQTKSAPAWHRNSPQPNHRPRLLCVTIIAICRLLLLLPSRLTLTPILITTVGLYKPTQQTYSWKAFICQLNQEFHEISSFVIVVTRAHTLIYETWSLEWSHYISVNLWFVAKCKLYDLSLFFLLKILHEVYFYSNHSFYHLSKKNHSSLYSYLYLLIFFGIVLILIHFKCVIFAASVPPLLLFFLTNTFS